MDALIKRLHDDTSEMIQSDHEGQQFFLLICFSMVELLICEFFHHYLPAITLSVEFRYFLLVHPLLWTLKLVLLKLPGRLVWSQNESEHQFGPLVFPQGDLSCNSQRDTMMTSDPFCFQARRTQTVYIIYFCMYVFYDA